MRRSLRYGAGGLTGVALGIVLTLAIQARSLPSAPVAPRGPSLLLTRPAPPETFLAWVPRGLPEGFSARVARQPEIGRLTVVAEDNVWLVRSWSAAGELVDRPVRPYRIPLDVAAVDPATFAPFLPPADQATLAAIENGEGILGSTSASVRRLGPGAVLELGGGSADPDRGGPAGRAGRGFGAPRVEGDGPPDRGHARALPLGAAARRRVDDVRITPASDPTAPPSGPGRLPARPGPGTRRDAVLPGRRRRPPSGPAEGALRRVRGAAGAGTAGLPRGRPRMDGNAPRRDPGSRSSERCCATEGSFPSSAARCGSCGMRDGAI